MNYLKKLALGLICLGALGTVSLASAQNRNFGARTFTMDDGAGHNFTMQAPAGMTGNVTYNMPLPPPGNPPAGFVNVGTSGGQTLFWNGTTLAWEASNIITNNTNGNGTNVTITAPLIGTTGAFGGSLNSIGASTIGTGTGLTNSFGNGSNATNNIGNGGGTTANTIGNGANNNQFGISAGANVFGNAANINNFGNGATLNQFGSTGAGNNNFGQNITGSNNFGSTTATANNYVGTSNFQGNINFNANSITGTGAVSGGAATFTSLTSSTSQTFSNFATAGVLHNAAGGAVASGPVNLASNGAGGDVNGVLAIANGGTGSNTQNFVDLTTAQTVNGNKTFTGSTMLATNLAGTVGIGTASPVSQLANTNLNVVGSDGRGVNTAGPSLTWIGSGGTGYAAAIYNSVTGSSNDGLEIKVTDNSNGSSALDVSRAASAATAGVPLLNVLANGNVGIGTNSGPDLLTVKGTVNSTGIGIDGPNSVGRTAYLDLRLSGGKIGNFYASGNDNNVYLNDASTANGSNLILETNAGGSGGKIGIGVTTPIGEMSNTATNMLGSDGHGISGKSFVWANSGNGYTGEFYNANVGLNSDGVAIKVADNSNSTVALDVSQGISASTTGIPLFTVRGNGVVTIPALNTVGIVHNNGSGVLSTGQVNLASGDVTGTLPVANGGTGSNTQNFVDLTTDQSIGGNKTFTGTTTLAALTQVGTANINQSGTASTSIGNGTGVVSLTGSINNVHGTMHINTAVADNGASVIIGNSTAGSTFNADEANINFNTIGTGTTTIGQIGANSGSVSINAGSLGSGINMQGPTNINIFGTGATTIGTGGTGAVSIGNTTGGTVVTGALTVTGNTNATGGVTIGGGSPILREFRAGVDMSGSTIPAGVSRFSISGPGFANLNISDAVIMEFTDPTINNNFIVYSAGVVSSNGSGGAINITFNNAGSAVTLPAGTTFLPTIIHQ